MRRSEASSTHRQTTREIVARNARVLGSVALGDDSDESAIDELVDPLPCTTLLELGCLQVELENALGLCVDLLKPGDLPAALRERVLREAVAVCGQTPPIIPHHV